MKATFVSAPPTKAHKERTNMPTHVLKRLFISAVIALASQVHADPQIDSWFTTYSGKYARVYLTDSDKSSGNAVSTWSRGSISQTIPAYCGIYFVGYSTSWVYIRSTGLASHTM